MPLVNVMVNGKAYTMSCAEGEEAHLRELAAMVDVKVREAQGMVGLNATDAKLMLTAALLMADEHHAAIGQLDTSSKAAGDGETIRAALENRVAAAESSAADALEAATKRVENIAARLVDA